MVRLGLERDVVDEGVRARAVKHLAGAAVELPTFAELCDPDTIPAEKREALAQVDQARVTAFDRLGMRDAVEEINMTGGVIEVEEIKAAIL